MHTELTDGVGRPRDYAAVAIQRGLAEIGCSDHAPIGEVNIVGTQRIDWLMPFDKLDTYVHWVRDAQNEFPQLPIKLGLEVDYFPHNEDWIRKLARLYDWDFFLGGVHFLGAWPVDESARYYEEGNVTERWTTYFEIWTKAAQSRLFDSMAHPDLPKKFNHYPDGDFTPVFEKALRAVKECDIAIEINTSGLRKACKEIYPSRRFLEIAVRLGVPISLGSDAHRPEETGMAFDQAVDLARSVGYREICRFTQRRREPVRL